MMPKRTEEEIATAVATLDTDLCTPGWKGRRSAFLAKVPMVDKDQLHAAKRDMREILRADFGDPAHAQALVAELPAWVRKAAIDTLLTWAWGIGTTCMHSPRISAPQPVFAASWHPRTVVCRRCTHMLGITTTRLVTLNCNNCAAPWPEPAIDTAMVWSIHVGALMFNSCLCPTCYAQFTPAQE